MRRILGPALAALLGLVLVLTSGAVAFASSTRASDGILYPACEQHVYHYDIDVPADAQSYSAYVKLLGPDGLEVSREYIDGSGPPQGAGDLQICGTLERVGRYTITVDAEYYDGQDRHDIAVPDSTFSMIRPGSRSQITKNGTHMQGKKRLFRLEVFVKDRRPKGYFPTWNASVTLQRRDHGHWSTFTQSVRTGQRGRVRVQHACSRPFLVRAHVDPDQGYYTASSTKAVKVCGKK